MRYRGPLSPEQAAAFWRLGMLTGDDIPRLAMQWLEEGSDSQSVAAIAGQSGATLREEGEAFERCLRELGANSAMSEREAAWRFIQTLLVAAREGAIAPLDATEDILAMDRRGIALFPRHNLGPGGAKYSGEELGIETMLGLYWSLDDVDASDDQVDEANRELKAECQRVLERFYTTAPSAWD